MFSKGAIKMRRYLVGMCQRIQNEGHSCVACELTESFNDLQKTHKRNERKLEDKKKTLRKRYGFEGRSCFKCLLHGHKLLEQNREHQEKCPYKAYCKPDKSFCDQCSTHEQFKIVQKKFCMMRREQTARQAEVVANQQEFDDNSSAEPTGGNAAEPTGGNAAEPISGNAAASTGENPAEPDAVPPRHDDQEMDIDENQTEVSIQKCLDS
jgi:hypothetical protein